MKKLLKIIALLTVLIALVIITVILLTPWMDRWGATEAEIAGTYPGDELVPAPASLVTRAITIQAKPEQVYPWLIQIGAEKGGWYTYSWLESLMNCPIVNADRIHDEWQDLKVGDEVKMCPGEFGPPAYTVAQLHPEQAFVLGHQDNGKWVDVWQFILVPQAGSSTRLIVRTRTMTVGGFWDIIHPGIFIMERGMIYGIKERAENSGAGSGFRQDQPAQSNFVTR